MDVAAKIEQRLEGLAEVLYSVEDMTQKVIRIRLILPLGEPESSIIATMRDLAESLLHKLTLRGIHEISNISTAKEPTQY